METKLINLKCTEKIILVVEEKFFNDFTFYPKFIFQ